MYRVHRATELCEMCGASRALEQLDPRLRLRNLRYFKLENCESAILRLEREFVRQQRFWAKRGVLLNFLRIDGTGDLFPEIIPVLNGFAMRNPNVRLWIVTRRFELARDVARLPNIFLQLSLDATTPVRLEHAARNVVATNPRAYLSFLRTSPTDDTRAAAIVFNEKHTDGLPFNGRTDCPVDAGRLQLGNVRGVGGTACAKCRKCFTESVLERQREMLHGRPLEKAKRRLLVVQADVSSR